MAVATRNAVLQEDGAHTGLSHERLAALGLHLNAPEPAIVCRRCGYALKSSGECVTRHLADKHAVSKLDRRGLSAWIRSLGLGHPNDLPLRPDGSPRHEFLSVHRGSACKHCSYRTTSTDLLRRHLAKEHRWRGSRKSDGWQRDHMIGDVILQSWTQNGARGYWIVQAVSGAALLPGADSVDLVDRVLAGQRARLALLHDTERAHIACQSPAGGDMVDADLSLTTNWMRRTGWAEMFDGARRDQLVRLSQLPSRAADGLSIGSSEDCIPISSRAEDEGRLLSLMAALDRLFDRCEDTVRHTDVSIRTWLRSQEALRPYKAPFELVGRVSTTRCYRRHIKRLLCFCFRIWRLDHGARKFILRRPLTRAQSRALASVWSDKIWSAPGGDGATQVPALDRDDDEDGEDEEDYEEDEDGEDDDNDGEEEDDDGEEQDDEDEDEDDEEDDDEDGDGEVDDEDDYDQDNMDEHQNEDGDGVLPSGSSILEQGDTVDLSTGSALEDLLLRLLYFLVTEEFGDGRSGSTLLVYFSGVLGLSADGQTFARPGNYTPKLSALIYCARLVFLESLLPRTAHGYIGWNARPRFRQLKKLNSVRKETMCLGSQAPLGELLSLRSYGRVVARSDGPSFRVMWSDDGQVMCWEQFRLSMSQFRSIAKDVLQRVTSSYSRLMYEWDPGYDLANVRDKMGNTTHGYSFVTEPANSLSEAYLQLSERACLGRVDGLFSEDSWDNQAVRRYLDAYDRALQQLSLLIYLTCGQAVRGTELLSIEHRNGTSTSRGVYVYSGSIAVVSRHHKARQATNNEFQVARFLPEAVGKLLYQHLVYVRPFAHMLCRTCCGVDMDSSLLFVSSRRPKEMWTTRLLSDALQSSSAGTLGYPVNVQVYRQISIAITEKHIKQISKPFNMHDDKSDTAPATSVFAWQSGHRPLQRATTYGLDGAYPDSLQPALLQLYRWASAEWHRFIQIDGPDLAPLAPGEIHASNSPAHPTPPPPGLQRTVNSEGEGVEGSPAQASSPSRQSRKRRLPLNWLNTSKWPAEPSERSQHPAQQSALLPPAKRACVTSSSETTRHSSNALHGGGRAAPSDIWAAQPLFGRLSEGRIVDEEQQKIVSYLRKIQVKIRVLNKGDAEIVFSDRSDNSGRCLGYQLDRRLGDIHKTTEKWSFVGCELCFVTTGRRQPDHDMNSCNMWAACEPARSILRWLESLAIPRYFDHRGHCSMCAHSWSVCDDVREGHRIYEVDPSMKGYRSKLIEQYDSITSPDGYCKNKPVVRRMVAALCTYDDQSLGKVLTKVVLDQDGVDIADEKQARRWFEQRVRSKDNAWVPRLLHVLDQLLTAFNFRQSEGHVLERPVSASSPEAEGLELTARWDNELEVQDWKAVLDWLAERCTFCAGQGLSNAQICHTLRRCERGGAEQARKRLGELFWDEGFQPSNGCGSCRLPRDFCSRWTRDDRGRWVLSQQATCRYDRRLLCDAIIGFASCGISRYIDDLMDGTEEYREQTGEDLPAYFDDEVAADWLVQPLVVAGIEGTQMIRQLAIWTRSLELYKVHSRNYNLG